MLKLLRFSSLKFRLNMATNHVTGYAAWCEFASANKGSDIFALFCGGKNADGKSWCPDCVTAEPVNTKK